LFLSVTYYLTEYETIIYLTEYETIIYLTEYETIIYLTEYETIIYLTEYETIIYLTEYNSFVFCNTKCNSFVFIIEIVFKHTSIAQKAAVPYVDKQSFQKKMFTPLRVHCLIVCCILFFITSN
jgi:hypothetical protein